MTVNDVASVKDYFDIKGFMIRDLKLKGNELLIYALVFSYSEKGAQTGYFGSLETIAQRIGSSKSRVCKVFSDLTARGLLLKSKVVDEHNITCCLYRTNYDYHFDNTRCHIDNTRCHIDNGTGVEMTPNIYNNNHNNNHLSSDEDIDSDESIKEQETDSTELNKDVGMNSLMNNIGMTRASDMNNEFLTSWMEDEPKDISDRKDMSKSNKSPKGKERKSSAGKKESKVKTPGQVVKSHYLELRNKLSASGIKFRNEIESTNGPLINQRLSHLMKDLNISAEDICLTFDYMSGEEYKVHQMDFSFVGCLREDIFLRSYNEMKSNQPKEPEYVPPAVKISRAICSKCGNELFFDGTCSFCELENYKK